MEKHFRKTSIVLILFFLFQVISQTIQTLAAPEKEDENGTWTHQASETKASDSCLREYDVSARFHSKVEVQPIDLVFIQDASGSFDDTIAPVKEKINNILDDLLPEDRMQLTTYRGVLGNLLPNGNWRRENWGGLHVRTDQPLTSDFASAKEVVNRFETGGGTPTALGLKKGLESYEENKGDVSDRKTVFILITDGVANARLHGYLKQRSNNYYYQTPRGRWSVEYNQDYKNAIAEVENQANYIKNKGYELIVGFWEDYDSFLEDGKYEDRYNGPLVHPNRDAQDYPARPNIIHSLKRTASSVDNFVMASTYEGENMDDFTKKLRSTLAKQRKTPDFDATFTVDDRYTIDESSVEIHPNPNKVLPVIEGNTITFDLGKLPEDDYEITYKIKQKKPIEEEHVSSTGTISVHNQNYVKKVINGPNQAACFYQPNIKKEVEGEEHLEIEKGKEYTYDVKTSIPEDIVTTSLYESLILSDKLDEGLQVVKANVLVNGESSDFEPVIDGQNISMTLSQKELQGLEGKEVDLQITAKIRENAPFEDIENKAIVQLNSQPELISNAVTVRPFKPKEPNIEKDIDGEKPEKPVEKIKGQPYQYHVHTDVPEDVTGYKILKLTDELDNRLEVVDAKVLIDGEPSHLNARITGQRVELALDRNQLEEIAGKGLTIEITAKIKSDVEAEVMDNTAQIQLNDNPKKDSNTVSVIPVEPTKPEIEKEVEGKGHIDIDYDTLFNYQITTTLPNNIADYQKFVVTDQVNKGLQVLPDNVVVTLDGKETDAINLMINENVVKAEVVNFQVLSGKKQIEINIPAKIRSDTDISQYPNDEIPNIANLNFINSAGEKGGEETKPVTVTPPRGSLELKKIDKALDEDGEKKVLSGAEFELRDQDGKVVHTGTTDENGKLSFADLPLGTYQLIETKAPEGYRLLKKTLEVEITAKKLDIQLEVENTKSGWELPKTGGIGTILFIFIGLALMSASVWGYMHYTKRGLFY